MKKTLLTLVVVAFGVSSFAQGTLNILNTLGTSFRAQVYGPQVADPGASLHGQSPAGVPPGSTAYTGPLLAGTGFSFAVYAGPSGTPEGSLALLITVPFRTGGAAGLISPLPDFIVPGVPTGQAATLQVRAWDNSTGGTFALATVRGASELFQSGLLGGGINFSPDMVGWTSFNIAAVPEPSTFVLAGLGAAALLIFRRRK